MRYDVKTLLQLLGISRKPSPSPAVDPALLEARFKDRLRLMPADDPLWPGLIATLDAQVLSEAEYAASRTTAEESHKCAGRLELLIELRARLASLPDDLRQEKAES